LPANVKDMANFNPFDDIDQRLQTIEDTLQQLVNKSDPNPPTTERFLTSEEVCQLLSCSRVSIWNWERAGLIQSFRIGNLKRFKMSDIEALAERRVK
jgi:excisionase family DNA binding protein